ncbi:MAG: alpha/beta fold hydrolase, partial [Thermoplasmata archaeon]|nr:alpha/beta fold hydrolase [Thermoplasmata archaeon]
MPEPVAPRSPEDRLRTWLEVPLSSQPSATSDGTSVLYISTAGGVPEAWHVGSERGPGHRLLASTQRVGTVQASPAGPRAIVATDDGGNEHWQLGIVELGSGTRPLRPLTDAPKVIHHPGRWSEDGRHYYFSSNARDARFFDVLALDPEAPQHPRSLLTADGTHGVVDVLGTRVLVSRATTNLDGDLFVIDGERTVHLTPHEGELSIFSAALRSDGVYAAANPGREHTALVRYRIGGGTHEFVQEFPGDVEQIRASPSGDLLALVVNRDGWSETHLFDPATREDRLLNSGPRGVVGQISWLPDGTAFAYDLSSVEGVDVFRRSVATGKERRLTGAPGQVPSPISPPRLARFRAEDGLTVPYWEYVPTRPKPRGTILYIHGGPEAQARPGFGPFLSFLVDEGWRVVAPNVRGSTGYGRTYTHLDDVRKRMDSVRDLRDLAAELVRQGKAESGRIALFGGSYGGFMVLAAAATYPKLWGAAVDLVGIANFVTFLERTGPWRRALREAEYGSLTQDREFLESISPLGHAAEIRAPLLVIHGRNDPRVPLFEAEQIVGTLR